MAGHLLITWTVVQDMCMAVMEVLTFPLWKIWNLLWFVFSHGWSLAIAVAAGTAIAVVISHRRSGSSSPGTVSHSCLVTYCTCLYYMCIMYTMTITGKQNINTSCCDNFRDIQGKLEPHMFVLYACMFMRPAINFM